MNRDPTRTGTRIDPRPSTRARPLRDPSPEQPMADAAFHPSASRLPMAAWLVLGGLVVGTTDLVFAWVFWQSHGVGLARILQSVAAGLLGGASFKGGVASALLGTGLHYFIATMFVLVYWLAGLRHAGLRRHPVACGVAYGALLYLAMNLIVVPLSAAGSPGFDNLPWVASSVVMHAVFGVMCALFARRA
jgi:hypothetical protein